MSGNEVLKKFQLKKRAKTNHMSTHKKFIKYFQLNNFNKFRT